VPEIVTREHAGRRATFSADGRYRYRLGEVWDAERRGLLFVMLNPSRATETENDPTIARCISFTKRERGGWWDVVNLYAYVTPYPRELRSVPDPVGPDADRYLEGAVCWATVHEGLVIAAWGAGYPPGKGRARDVLALLTKHAPVYCFGITRDGSPKHPLYLNHETQIIPYAPQYKRGTKT